MIHWICNKLGIVRKHELNSAALWQQLEMDMLIHRQKELDSRIAKIEATLTELKRMDLPPFFTEYPDES